MCGVGLETSLGSLFKKTSELYELASIVILEHIQPTYIFTGSNNTNNRRINKSLAVLSRLLSHFEMKIKVIL